MIMSVDIKKTKFDDLDVEKIPDELKPFYKEMQAGLMRSMQEASDLKKAVEAEKAEMQQTIQQFNAQLEAVQKKILSNCSLFLIILSNNKKI